MLDGVTGVYSHLANHWNLRLMQAVQIGPRLQEFWGYEPGQVAENYHFVPAISQLTVPVLTIDPRDGICSPTPATSQSLSITTPRTVMTSRTLKRADCRCQI